MPGKNGQIRPSTKQSAPSRLSCKRAGKTRTFAGLAIIWR